MNSLNLVYVIGRTLRNHQSRQGQAKPALEKSSNLKINILLFTIILFHEYHYFFFVHRVAKLLYQFFLACSNISTWLRS